MSGGGFALFGRGALNDSRMSADHQSWFVIGGNQAVIEGKITAFVYCAGAGQAVAARSNAAAGARAIGEAHRAQEQLAQLLARSR